MTAAAPATFETLSKFVKTKKRFQPGKKKQKRGKNQSSHHWVKKKGEGDWLKERRRRKTGARKATRRGDARKEKIAPEREREPTNKGNPSSRRGNLRDKGG